MNRTFLGLVAASTVVLAISACKEEAPTNSAETPSASEAPRKLEENEHVR